MKKFSAAAILIFFQSICQADVALQSSCYEKIETPPGKVKSFFLFKSYYDNNLLQDVGAIVSYNNSKKLITLAYSDESQSEGPDTGQGVRVKVWLEILNGRINGRYIQEDSIDGNPAGGVVRYTSMKSKVTTIFRRSTTEAPCAGDR